MKNNKSYILFLFVSFILTNGCKEDTSIDCNVFHWGYEEESGPEHWAGCFEDCDGQAQSPVDITGAIQDNTLVPLSVDYEDAPVNLINNGHTVEFEYESGSVLLFDGVQYELLQFHFHAESEHSVSGQLYPLEVHLVHKNEASGNLAVIGILFETGDENTFLQQFINNLPDETDEYFQVDTLVNVGELLPEDHSYYTYGGSLTTPPCSEIVTWVLLKTPVEISNPQLQQFTSILHNNNRPIQQLHGRMIRESM